MAQHYALITAHKSGWKEFYNVKIGSVECLEKFNTKLPRYPLVVPIPAPFSWHWQHGYPLFLPTVDGSNAPIAPNIKIDFQRSIAKLLRMQMKENNEWIDIVPELDYLDGISSDRNLVEPEVWAMYTFEDLEEIKLWHCKEKIELNTLEFITFDTSNPLPLGKVIEYDGIHHDMPFFCNMFGCENQTAKIKNNLSNYSTNADDVYNGWSPMEEVSYRYGGKERYKNIHIALLDMENYYHLPSFPTEAGHSAFAISLDTTIRNAQVGVVHTGNNKAKLSVKLGDGDIFKKPVAGHSTNAGEKVLDVKKLARNKVPDITSDEYVLKIRSLVMRRVTYTAKKLDKSDEKRVYIIDVK
jgi:hypothetical protein